MRFGLILFLALTLTACVKPVRVITALPQGAAQGYDLKNVNAAYSPQAQERIEKIDTALAAKATADAVAAKQSPDSYQSFKTVLPRIVKSRLVERGMHGGKNINIEVKVDTLKLADPALAFLFGDTDQLSGFVFVKDASSNKIIGEYYVDSIVGKGGIIGAAQSGLDARQRLAVTFADHFADQLELPKAKPKNTYKANAN